MTTLCCLFVLVTDYFLVMVLAPKIDHLHILQTEWGQSFETMFT